MNEEDITVLKDKVKYVLELEEGKQYLFVFDLYSGLTKEAIRKFAEDLEKEYKIKVSGLLIEKIDSMRVLTLEETKK